jgi:phosphate transport system protein
MSTKPHLLSTFNEAMEKVREGLREMANRTLMSFSHAQAGLIEGDVERCNAAIADDDEVDQLEIVVGRDSTQVLVRFQPVASDLRHIVAAMRMCSDLERVADQAVNIARKTRRLVPARAEPYRSKLLEMFNEATMLLKDSLQAYEDGNVELARAIPSRDRKLDHLNAEVTELATAQIAAAPTDVSDHLAIILIARHIERVGDHAKNIAENAIYVASDEDVRHNPGESGVR